MRDRAPEVRSRDGNGGTVHQGGLSGLRLLACHFHAGNRDPAQASHRGAQGGSGNRRSNSVSANLQERITDALSRVRNNRIGTNVLEAEMVRDIATTTDGKVRLSLFLSADDDATVVREVRHSLQQIPGVTDVRVDVKDASQAN